jgi:RimJ/RimL family protein N-acetyltransferase
MAIPEVDGKPLLAALAFPDAIEGPRLVFRPFEPSDAAALFAAVQESRETLLPWLGWAKGYHAVEEALDFCVRQRARWLTREGFGGGLFRRTDGAFLGGFGVHPHDWRARIFEIGYWARTSAQRRGYVREAVMVTTQLLFESYAANRVVIRCDTDNERSRRVAEACGFVCEGRHRRDGLTSAGTLRDTLVFALVREDCAAALPAWRDALRVLAEAGDRPGA